MRGRRRLKPIQNMNHVSFSQNVFYFVPKQYFHFSRYFILFSLMFSKHDLFKPFPTSRCILTNLQQATFENIVAKRENCSSFIDLFHFFAQMVSKLSAPDFLYVGKGSIQLQRFFYFLTKYVQSRLLQNCHMRKRVKGFCNRSGK